MFAASLKTLQKRTTQLLKGDEGKREAERLDDVDPNESLDLGGVLGDTAADGSVIVRYQVQNGEDADSESAAFVLPVGAGAGVTPSMIRQNFPLPGNFHFRFRVPTPDNAFGGTAWMDLANDSESVPMFRGGVFMKVLRLPADVAPVAYEALPGSVLKTPLNLSSMPINFNEPCDSDAGPSRSLSPRSPPFRNAPLQKSPASSDLMEEPSSPVMVPDLVAAAPAVAAPAGLPDDLMEMDMRGGLAAGSAAAARPVAVAAAPAVPAVPLDRDKLRADREAKERQRVEDQMNRHNELRDKETKTKADKVHLNNRLGAEMDAWARTPDGQSFKDIRTLLSTVHTVIWADSGWTPISLADLVANSGNVKKYYRKAIIQCHPDRHQHAEPEQQVRADRIFQALNEAFKVAQNDGS